MDAPIRQQNTLSRFPQRFFEINTANRNEMSTLQLSRISTHSHKYQTNKKFQLKFRSIELQDSVLSITDYKTSEIAVLKGWDCGVHTKIQSWSKWCNQKEENWMKLNSEWHAFRVGECGTWGFPGTTATQSLQPWRRSSPIRGRMWTATFTQQSSFAAAAASISYEYEAASQREKQMRLSKQLERDNI